MDVDRVLIVLAVWSKRVLPVKREQPDGRDSASARLLLAAVRPSL
jgi:hypothetical protein